MSELDHDLDTDMQVVDWEGGDDMDAEFRNEFGTGNCVEVDFDTEDAPIDSGGEEGLSDENPDEEIGVIPESEIYGDGDVEPCQDDASATVSHKESVLSVALCPADWRVMLTGGQDDVAVLWKLEEHASGLRCAQRCRLEGHTDSVVQVAFSHDGVYVATGSYDGTVRIWATEGGTLVHTLEGPSKEVEWILWHPKGHAILAGSADTMAWMWWAPTGKLMQIFAGHAQSVTCGCWGLAGKLIVTGSEDRGVIVWNPRAGAPQQHLRQVHDSSIISICSHPEAPIVVTGSEDSCAKVIQIETGKILTTLSGHTDSVESVGFNSPAAGGMLLLATASMDGKVLVWDGKSYDLRCTLKDHFEHGGVVKFRWLPTSPYSAWLCTCSTDQTLKLFNCLSGECIRTLQGHSDTVLDVDLALGAAPGAEAGPQLYVAAGSDDKTCRVFKVALWTGGEGHAAPEALAAVGEDARQQPHPAVVGRPQAVSPAGSPTGDPSAWGRTVAPQEAAAAAPEQAGTPPAQAERGTSADTSPGGLPV